MSWNPTETDDNWPHFSFKEFCKVFQSNHETSSQYFQSSNGEAKYAIPTIKKLWKKNDDKHISLLGYMRGMLMFHIFSLHLLELVKETWSRSRHVIRNSTLSIPACFQQPIRLNITWNHHSLFSPAPLSARLCVSSGKLVKQFRTWKIRECRLQK